MGGLLKLRRAPIPTTMIGGYQTSLTIAPTGLFEAEVYVDLEFQKLRAGQLLRKGFDRLIGLPPRPVRLHHDEYDATIYVLDGKMHRDDGPAFERNHTRMWYRQGLRHRTDGPAVEHNYASETSYGFWIDGVHLPFNDPATILRFADWFADYYSKGNLDEK